MTAPDPHSRRARKFLYFLGVFFMVLGIAVLFPPLADEGVEHGGQVLIGVGVLLLVGARFGSERFVRRCEALLTGWP